MVGREKNGFISFVDKQQPSTLRIGPSTTAVYDIQNIVYYKQGTTAFPTRMPVGYGFIFSKALTSSNGCHKKN